MDSDQIPTSVKDSIHEGSAPSYTDRFWVIYPCSEPDFALMADSFLRSALELIDKFKNKKVDPYDDELALPFLSNLVHALEYELKNYINVLIVHEKRGSCKVLSTPPGNFQRTMNEHDLVALADILIKMLPGKGKLHSFEDFERIYQYLYSLEEIGITSESTRYQTDTRGAIYELHTKQSYVIFDNLFSEISAICRLIRVQSSSSEIYLCSAKDYTKRRAVELAVAHKLLEALSSKFRQYGEVVQNEAELEDIRLNSSVKIFFDTIENLTVDELAHVVMGLYFSSRAPITIEDVGYFQRWGRKKLLEKIIERAHFCDDAIRGLDVQIKKIENNKLAKI